MLREFDNGMAVTLDGAGNVLRQLVSFKIGLKGRTYFSNPKVALMYAYKKEAVAACKAMGWPLDRVCRGENLASSFWFIRNDYRDKYALACWDV